MDISLKNLASQVANYDPDVAFSLYQSLSSISTKINLQLQNNLQEGIINEPLENLYQNLCDVELEILNAVIEHRRKIWVEVLKTYATQT